MKIGFIGQGWIGKNYADDFENRGYTVVRYALEAPYVTNKDEIATCDIVFIAVPTPTTPEGFDGSYLEATIPLVGKGKTAVIKSTILPGTTKKLQEKYPDQVIMHSPEFLVEKTAAYNAANPDRNLVGIPIDSELYREKAEAVLSVLPDAPYAKIMAAKDAELVKYANNCFLYTKVVYMNLLYDLVAQTEGSWEDVRNAMVQDPRVGESHTEPVHSSGRGAGGHCFIKDFEVFRRMYESSVGDGEGIALVNALRDKNNQLLKKSNKDQSLIKEVYGDV